MDVSTSHCNEERSVLLMDGLGSLMLPPVICLPERGGDHQRITVLFPPQAEGIYGRMRA